MVSSHSFAVDELYRHFPCAIINLYTIAYILSMADLHHLLRRVIWQVLTEEDISVYRHVYLCVLARTCVSYVKLIIHFSHSASLTDELFLYIIK